MHITAIESFRLEAYQRLLLVRVHTDTGLVGIGETVDKIPGTLGAVQGSTAPLLLGQDPLDIEGNWRFVFDNLMYHGYSGAELRALSAIEIALWDVLGQHYGAPLFHLLGGRTREWIPTYNTCIGTPGVDDYRAWHDHDRDAGALAKSLLADGISAMKIWPFDPYSERSLGQYIAPADLEAGLRPVKQIRDAVGEKMEIAIECHFRWNRSSAERIAHALEPYNILFLEDPLAAVNLDEINFSVLSDYTPQLEDGRFAVPSGPGLGVCLREEVLSRADLSRQVSEGPGLAVGRRAMGDHWEREEIR